MSNFKFRSVGNVRGEAPKLTEEDTRTPIGFALPLEPAESGNGSTFRVLDDFREVTRQNLANLLATNYGERLGRYSYGANLIEFLPNYELSNDGNEIIERIHATVAKWMPYVRIDNVGIIRVHDSIKGGDSAYTFTVAFSAPDMFIGSEAVTITLSYL